MDTDHHVIAGNVGSVYLGHSHNDAEVAFNEHVQLSKLELGRVAGEAVTWLIDGEVFREHHGHTVPRSFKAEIAMGVCNIPKSLEVDLPGIEQLVEVGLDLWGDAKPLFQTLHYDATPDADGEVKVAVRYDATGKLVEVMIDDPDVRIVRGDENESSPWEVERDGE